jgi:hypothetical protein
MCFLNSAVVASAGASEEHYQEVVAALADALEPLTDDWYSLHNALLLLEFLLPRCPLLAAEFIAAPYVVRQLLGYWAEDANGRDCGAVVRARAAAIVGQLEDMELQRLRLERVVRPPTRSAVRQDLQTQCNLSQIWRDLAVHCSCCCTRACNVTTDSVASGWLLSSVCSPHLQKS